MNAKVTAFPESALDEICERHQIVSLKLFGSALRDDFTDTSDLDLLVEFSPDRRIGYFGLSALEQELTGLFGRRVDLNTSASLSPHFREEVLGEAESLYDAPQR